LKKDDVSETGIYFYEMADTSLTCQGKINDTVFTQSWP